MKYRVIKELWESFPCTTSNVRVGSDAITRKVSLTMSITVASFQFVDVGYILGISVPGVLHLRFPSMAILLNSFMFSDIAMVSMDDIVYG